MEVVRMASPVLLFCWLRYMASSSNSIPSVTVSQYKFLVSWYTKYIFSNSIPCVTVSQYKFIVSRYTNITNAYEFPSVKVY